MRDGRGPGEVTMKLLVLGATGTVGRLIVAQALAAGHVVTAQGRSPARLAEHAPGATPCVCDPADGAALAAAVSGQDAVVFALGVDKGGATTVFSDVTAVLLPAMAAAGVRRLVAITGVGAGETRGHGGFLYDQIIYRLFTRHRYADKERQEELIAASDRDWVIVRPASFADSAGEGPLQVHVEVSAGTVLRRITRAEVARFVIDQLTSDRYLRRKPFIGYP